jgi:hypothetical protein
MRAMTGIDVEPVVAAAERLLARAHAA